MLTCVPAVKAHYPTSAPARSNLLCLSLPLARPLDKWACPSIEIVDMQQATSVGVVIQL